MELIVDYICVMTLHTSKAGYFSLFLCMCENNSQKQIDRYETR